MTSDYSDVKSIRGFSLDSKTTSERKVRDFLLGVVNCDVLHSYEPHGTNKLEFRQLELELTGYFNYIERRYTTLRNAGVFDAVDAVITAVPDFLRAQLELWPSNDRKRELGFNGETIEDLELALSFQIGNEDNRRVVRVGNSGLDPERYEDKPRAYAMRDFKAYKAWKGQVMRTARRLFRDAGLRCERTH